MMRALILIGSIAIAACGTDPASPTDAAPVERQAAEYDPLADLVDAPGAELVMQHCIACHGPRQFLQQRGDRETWLGLIRWMQREHGLWQLPPDVEDRIVTYLATHYGPEEHGRRPPIPAALMPPNPFGGSAGADGR